MTNGSAPLPEAALNYRWGAIRGEAGAPLAGQQLELYVDGKLTEAPHPQWRGKAGSHLKLRLPPSVFDGNDHAIRLTRPDGTAHSADIELTAEDLLRDRFDSNLANAGGLTLRGWVQDGADPDAEVALSFRIHGEDITAIETEIPRPTIHRRFGGRLECGFSVQVPPELLDEQPRPVRVATIDGDMPLKGGPHKFDALSSLSLLTTSLRSRLFSARQICWNHTELS